MPGHLLFGLVEGPMFKIEKHNKNLVSEIISSDNLEKAFKHVYKKHIQSYDNNDKKHLSRNWKQIKLQIQRKLLNNTYNLKPLKILKSKENTFCVWNVEDAILLKATSIILGKRLNIKAFSSTVYHLSGERGLERAIKNIHEITSNSCASSLNAQEVNNDNNEQYKHVIRSGIDKLYSETDHLILVREYKKYIKDRRILRIVTQYSLRLKEIENHNLYENDAIFSHCSLYLLTSAIILRPLDRIMKKLKNVAYLRYMNNWVIFARTKVQLRSCIKKMYYIINKLKLNLAIDKTFIGKIERGFDFLEKRFDDLGLITKIYKST